MKNLTYKISLLILGLFAASSVMNAQEIRGVVSDVNGEPLIGVSVFVDGTTLGVSTGVDGDYVIDVPDAKGKTLVFSMIGMATKNVVIGNSTTLNVVLEEDANFLDETVVIGYATVKRRDLMGSVSSVDNKSLTQVPVASVTEALSGRMAGVQVTATEGDPDAEIKIRVRGGGSITQDSSPLYIVDGFPVESISDIPASDIQSIDVLKDAFSTAIYGSRGANGVVLVTTKSGSSGKVSVSYNVYYGQKKMANKDAIQVMNPGEFVKLQWELGVLNDDLDDEFIPAYGAWEDMDQYASMSGNDWVQQVFGRTGTSFNQNLSVSGGSDKVKWTASYAHVGDNAIMLGSDYKRDNLTFKTQYKPIKQLTFDINARYSRTAVMGAGSNSINDSGSTSGTSARLKHAVQYTPIPVTGATSDSDLAEDYGDNAPPLESVKDNDRRRIRENWTINGSVTWHIINNLNLKVEGGLDDYSEEDNRFYGLTTYYVGNTATIKNQPANLYSNHFRKKYRNTNTLSYNFSDVIKDERHKLDLLLGQEYILTQSNNLSTTVEGFPSFFTSEMAWNFMASGTAIASGVQCFAGNVIGLAHLQVEVRTGHQNTQVNSAFQFYISSLFAQIVGGAVNNTAIGHFAQIETAVLAVNGQLFAKADLAEYNAAGVRFAAAVELVCHAGVGLHIQRLKIFIADTVLQQGGLSQSLGFGVVTFQIPAVYPSGDAGGQAYLQPFAIFPDLGHFGALGHGALEIALDCIGFGCGLGVVLGAIYASAVQIGITGYGNLGTGRRRCIVTSTALAAAGAQTQQHNHCQQKCEN